MDKIRNFQSFLLRNLKKIKHFGKIKPVSNQPAVLYDTGKRYKFDNINKKASESIKFLPIKMIFFYTDNVAQVISNCLRILYENVYSITETQSLS